MSRSASRWAIGVSIVGFWLVMMGLLLRNEFGGRRLDTTGLPRQRLTSVTDSWLGVYLGDGPRVGYIHLRQIPEKRRRPAAETAAGESPAGESPTGESSTGESPAGELLAGVRMVLEARLRLNVLGKSTDLDLAGSVWQPYEGGGSEFEFSIRSAGHELRLTGEVSGGELRGSLLSAGETLPLRIPVDEGMIFSSGLGSTLRFPRLEVGDVYRLDSFDPLTLSKGEARVRCVAREQLEIAGAFVDTWRLEVEMNGLTSLAWVDSAGEVVRAETSIGLVLQRITAGEARVISRVDAASAEDLADFLGRTAIEPTGLRPFRSAREMTVQLRGLEGLKLPEDRVQTSLGDGRYLLRTPPEPPAEPPAGSSAGGLAAFLQADAFVQSDHPTIRDRAAAVTAGETDPWAMSLKIHDWVFARLDKESVISIPSALEVLEQRRGDCNEHTVLFAALARSQGIATRIAIGIVWSDELEGFYYHAWPEVFVGDWVWMDPTLGQPLADATHIKLLNGGIEKWPQLLPYLGKLEVEVVGIE